MNKILALAVYVFIVAATQESGFSLTPRTQSQEILDQVRARLSVDLEAFRHSIVVFGKCVGGVAPATMRSGCSAAYRDLRDAYKRVEFVMEFLDQRAVSLYFNGAPLPALEPEVPEVVVLDPEGLQVIDELMFLDMETDPNQEEIVTLNNRLQQALDQFVKVRNAAPVNHQHVWNGVRVGIIRIHSLGITGFDTPGDGASALPDTRAALDGMRDYLEIYQPLMNDSEQRKYQQYNELVDHALQYISQNDNFDTFDRLAFTKDFLNPMFANLLELQKMLGVELPHEYAFRSALNLEVKSLYDIEIFNKQHFTNAQETELSDHRVALGKTLFFDRVLSSSLKTSCASCHNPQLAFTDGMKKSLASSGQGTILRNAPTLINCVYTEKFFYDLKEEFLERQIKHVVRDKLEFNTDFIAIVDKLQQSQEYVAMFAEAYPDSPYQLSKWSISDALSAYVASLTSFNSPVDAYIAGETSELDESVYNGYNLFMGKAACGSCHFAPSFSGLVPPFYKHSESEVLGVPMMPDTANASIDPDFGRIANGIPQDGSAIYMHAFKTPTVRNAGLTAPYMHNGVYEELAEVVDFYNRGGGAGIGIDLPNQTLPPNPLGLTEPEIADLVAFMEALTDTTGLTEVPSALPLFDTRPEWNDRKVVGGY